MPTDSTQRFSSRVADYVRYRPGYPDDVVLKLQSQFGWSGQQTIADIGSGTGISAELFLRHGHVVYGVEPNQEMREAGEEFLAKYRTVNGTFYSVDGTAEATTLSDAVVDGIIAGQAFHWFDPDRARSEFLRILRPGGWGVLMWNARRPDSSPFMRAYEELLNQFSIDLRAIRHENIAPEVFERFFQGGHTYQTLDNSQSFDLAGVRGRLLSSSYAPPAGHARHSPMLAALEQIFDAHQTDGRVQFVYDTQLYAGRLSA